MTLGRQGHIQLNSYVWDLNCTNKNGPNADYYHNSAFIFSYEVLFPISSPVGLSNSLTLSVDQETFWDVQRIIIKIVRRFPRPAPINSTLGTLSKNGTDYTIISGDYLTSLHRPSGTSDPVLSPNDLILGAYNWTNPSSWRGATVQYSFDTSAFITAARIAVLNITWDAGIGINASAKWQAGISGEFRVASGEPNNISSLLKCEYFGDHRYTY